jgi:hypothetical protein
MRHPERLPQWKSNGTPGGRSTLSVVRRTAAD